MPIQATQTTVDLTASAPADLTTLQDTRISDGYRVWVSQAGASHGLWVLDQNSVAVVDGITVVATLSGVGRWLLFGGGGGGGASSTINVPNEATLTATGVSTLNDGTFAWVGDPLGGIGRSQGAGWRLVTQIGGAPVLSPHMVIASNAGGRVWMRHTTLANQRWVQSATWFLSGATGNDENDGQTAGTPLLTGAELARRMAKQTVGNGVPVVVTLLANIADSLDFTEVKGIINIQGVQTTTAVGTLTAAAAINRAGNTFQRITAAAFNFAAAIAAHSKIVLTSGALTGAESFLKSGAGGVGVIAETSPFNTQPGGSLSGAVTTVSPAGTETFKIVTMTTCVSIIVDGEGSGSFASQLIAVTNVTPTAQGDAFRDGTLLLNRLDLAQGGQVTFTGSAVAFPLGCKLPTHAIVETAQIVASDCLIIGAPIGVQPCTAIYSQDTVFFDCTVSINNGNFKFDACGVDNSTAARHFVNGANPNPVINGKITIATALYGVLAGAGSIGFLTGKFLFIDGGGVVPTLTTTGANVAFGSANKTWAQLPFVDQFNVGAGPVAGSNMAGWL